MGCCGEARRRAVRARPETSARRALPGINAARSEPLPRRALSYFEYVGRTGMTVIGPITGRHYRFDGRGAVVAVDRRDEPSLPAVPHLRRLDGPVDRRTGAPRRTEASG